MAGLEKAKDGKGKVPQAPRTTSCMAEDTESPSTNGSAASGSEHTLPQPPTESRAKKAPAARSPAAKVKAGDDLSVTKTKQLGSGDKSETRGRKARNLDSDMAKLEYDFERAPDTDSIFWGEECKVGQKMFEDINKAIQARYKKSTSEAEEDVLKGHLKASHGIWTVLNAADVHGMNELEGVCSRC